MELNIHYLEQNICAYKNCSKSGSKKLKILYIHKEGWFCEECASKLIEADLIQIGGD